MIGPRALDPSGWQPTFVQPVGPVGTHRLPKWRMLLVFVGAVVLLSNLPKGGPAAAVGASWAGPDVPTCTVSTVTLADFDVAGWSGGEIRMHLTISGSYTVVAARWVYITTGYLFPSSTFSTSAAATGEWWATTSTAAGLGFTVPPGTTGEVKFVVTRLQGYSGCFTIDHVVVTQVPILDASIVPGTTALPTPSTTAGPSQPASPSAGASWPAGWCWITDDRGGTEEGTWVECAAPPSNAPPSWSDGDPGNRSEVTCTTPDQDVSGDCWAQLGITTLADDVYSITFWASGNTYQADRTNIFTQEFDAQNGSLVGSQAATGRCDETVADIHDYPDERLSYTSPAGGWWMRGYSNGRGPCTWHWRLQLISGPSLQSPAPSSSAEPTPSGWPSYPPLPTFGPFPSFAWPSYPPFAWPSGGLNICQPDASGATPGIAACVSASGGPGTSFDYPLPDASGAVSGFDALASAMAGKLPFGVVAQVGDALGGFTGNPGGAAVDMCTSIPVPMFGGSAPFCIPDDFFASLEDWRPLFAGIIWLLTALALLRIGMRSVQAGSGGSEA